ncbi:MAG: RNA methyltransferase [Chitinophagaceae bacterium]|nr:MAG: RNA methyltransferase [Chitinophagaceae bacterium]
MLTNNLIKFVKSLQLKKFRDKNNLFIAEGIKTVESLFNSSTLTFEYIFITPGDFIEKLQIEKQKPLKIIEISENEMKKISGQTTITPVLAVIQKKDPPKLNYENNGLYLALDGIQDPGNLGTILRIADWFGVKALICSNDTVDVYNPKVVQSSMGSLGNVNFVYTELNNFLKIHFESQSVLAADVNGISVFDYRFPEKSLIILGNEGKGIRDYILSENYKKISIPAFGKAESLNVAVAGSILSSLWRKQYPSSR